MEFFDSMIEKGLVNRLKTLVSQEFQRLSYTSAITILQEVVKKGIAFDNKNIFWGMDLQSEHERYICEKHLQGPVFLTDYPKEIKAFYMRLNDDGKTVAACDLLVPGVGEMIGGSQREERYDYLIKRMEEMKISSKGLEWYLDLRRYGGVKHAGFGLGFERMLMYITGMQNIRDVIPFPRTPKNLLF
jgi:asparaginyl-tRNA synthetase